MFRWSAVILSCLGLALLQTAFLSALPAPWRGLDLVLIAVVGLVANFRSKYAFGAIAAAGLVQDILTSSAAGWHIFLGVAVVLAVSALFARIITNISWLSFAALNAVGYLLAAALAAGLGLAGDLTFGRPLGRPTAAGAGLFLLELLLQVAASLLALLAAKALKKAVRSRFIFADHAR